MSFLSDNRKKILTEFVKFVRERLEIKSLPRIRILNGRSQLKTTANYDYTKEEKVMNINGRGRAVVDIMRSIAHELTHHKQWEQGRLETKPPDIGGEIEDEANAIAGQLIKLFAKKDSTIYDEELDEQDTLGGSGTEGYPEVSTWSDIVGSKLTRGPGNQIELTKWGDVVGSQISRGPDNQLK